MQYVGMPYSWVDFYYKGFESIKSYLIKKQASYAILTQRNHEFRENAKS